MAQQKTQLINIEFFNINLMRLVALKQLKVRNKRSISREIYYIIIK